MAVAVLMPKQGITVESCVITAWHKKIGDEIKTGDPLFTYETDKSSFDVEAEASGTLLAVFYPDGEDIPVLSAVAAIGAAGEDVSSLAPGAATLAETPKIAQPEPAKIVIPGSAAAPPSGKQAISPRARAVAGQLGVDASVAAGTGPYGRVIERDVRALFAQPGIPALSIAQTPDTSAVPAAQPKGGVREERLSPVRRAIARSMTASLTSMAQLTLHSSFDATAILAQRAVFKASEDPQIAGITLTDMVHFAVAKALARPEHAHLNAHLEGETMRYFSDVHLAFAVDTPRGLLVPVIFGAECLTLRQLSLEAKRLAKLCQAGSVPPDLLAGGTFTVSNLGGLGIEHFTPVINPPQTGIMGLDNILHRPKSLSGELYPAMGLCITFDHRALDGADAARFLRTVGQSLERFTALMAG